jgi:hypothetical protein
MHYWPVRPAGAPLCWWLSRYSLCVCGPQRILDGIPGFRLRTHLQNICSALRRKVRIFGVVCNPWRNGLKMRHRRDRWRLSHLSIGSALAKDLTMKLSDLR